MHICISLIRSRASTDLGVASFQGRELFKCGRYYSGTPLRIRTIFSIRRVRLFVWITRPPGHLLPWTPGAALDGRRSTVAARVQGNLCVVI